MMTSVLPPESKESDRVRKFWFEIVWFWFKAFGFWFWLEVELRKSELPISGEFVVEFVVKQLSFGSTLKWNKFLSNTSWPPCYFHAFHFVGKINNFFLNFTKHFFSAYLFCTRKLSAFGTNHSCINHFF